MIFKDRSDAGGKLLIKLSQNLKKIKGKIVVVSLLRGGIVVGNIIAKGLNTKHLPLVVTKISSPKNPELAIGALCFDVIYLEKKVISLEGINRFEVGNQIGQAKRKFESYVRQFAVKSAYFTRFVKNRVTIIVDDGVATGATIKAAVVYLKSKHPTSLVLAVPVAPDDFSAPGVDEEIILEKPEDFNAVSRFYKNFPQIEDETVKKIMKSLN